MDILETTAILILSAVLNIIITYVILRIILFKLNLKPLITFAKAYAGQMGMRSGESKRKVKNAVLAKGAKAKVTAAAIEELPGGGLIKKIIEKAGVSPEEIFALLTDSEFMAGIQVMVKTFGGVVEKLTGKDKEAQADHSLDAYRQ